MSSSAGLSRGSAIGIVAVAREQQLLLLRDADRDQPSQPELLERRVRGRQLPLAAVDQDEIGKRPAGLEDSTIAAQDDFVHRGEVVIGGSRLAASRLAAAARLEDSPLAAAAGAADQRLRSIGCPTPPSCEPPTRP